MVTGLGPVRTTQKKKKVRSEPKQGVFMVIISDQGLQKNSGIVDFFFVGRVKIS